ncbi:hypothetical protein EW146_g5137 [Bondarzewia mesenterica]|uniref:beta-glucosidase n=1 Tax=Bondarzewia mesenterica TaxID=1095465 RepID=A0A4S4LSF0_9AGAM|nr:hypothetical protein EW146_g5137 [Bondarzewia mesenterica]
MPPSDFAKADLDEIVGNLTTEESIQLIAGVGFWRTYAIPRLGIPSIKVTDGPNGIRGNHFFMSTPAKCLPCATALAATWDANLIQEVGSKLLAEEAKLKAASILLGPTCNIQRDPLGGRSFESFAEDPYLSGIISAAYVKGVQSGGIGVTIKHFVANDKENDRKGYDSIVSERALREVYLMPFMLSEKFAKPWSVLTAYNRVNGTHAAENAYLIRDILRKEWGFEGMVMSDWYGQYSIDNGINAGLDLEMPGTDKWRTLEVVQRSIEARKVTLRTVKERARKVLQLVHKCAQGAPKVLDGDGQERTRESDDDKALMRKLAADAIVLLKNDHSLLPLQLRDVKKIAIVGGNAKAPVWSGGGSASLKPSYFVSPFDGIKNALPADVEVTYSEGARAFMTLPSLDFDMVTETNEKGWSATWHRHLDDDSMTVVDSLFQPASIIDETRIYISASAPKGITRRWTMRLRGQLRPCSYDRKFEFGLIVSGRAKLFVDGNLVIDNWTRQRRGTEFFGYGTLEERGIVELKANQTHSIFVEFCNVRGPADGDEDEAVMDNDAGVRLGGAEVVEPDALMEEAVRLAGEADVAIAVIGLNADWETEGYDRTTLALPGRTDELVEKVAKANPKTIVITQSGSAITMPWAGYVGTLLHSWYLGNATGDAIADVLLGKVNPSGKLSLTFPKRMQDMPSYGHFNSEDGKVRYAEDIFVTSRRHSLLGTACRIRPFAYSDLELSNPAISGNDVRVTATFTLTNTGNVAGSEVAQLYTTLPTTSALTHVPLALKSFTKVYLEPGQSDTVRMYLDKYAVSYWNERLETWTVEPGEYRVRVGASSQRLPLEDTFKIDSRVEWNGL